MRQHDTAAVERTEAEEKTYFGFWMFIMTDCVLFASLFATYAVLVNGTSGGPTGQELFNIPLILAGTLALLTSSFTCGLAILSARQGNLQQARAWLVATLVLGLAFLAMEYTEFAQLIHEGNSWQRSGFLSIFFALVGTHGLHVAVGLLWIITLLVQSFRRGITNSFTKRMTLFGMYWHFLDIIWILLFTIVYLMGVI